MNISFFCIHHSPCVERKNYIDKHIVKNFNIPISWIHNFDPDSDDVKNQSDVFNTHSADKIKLNKAEISCFMKHRFAIRQIAESNHFGFIFEDDIQKPSFDLHKATTYFIQEMNNNNIDILFVGSFGNYDIETNKEYEIFCNHSTKSRCAHAYILSDRCAKSLILFLDNIIAPFDWQINYAIDELNLKSCWSYPHIYQRSEKQEIKSLLR
jgi:GR25 family glycosyltransferase involved in LPS biosynthesis